MDVSDDTLQSLRAALPADVKRLRISVRNGDLWLLSEETDDPIGALSRLSAPRNGPVECRIEVAGPTGEFATHVPWFRLNLPPTAEAMTVTGPADPNGLPVRLMVYDEATKSYIADFSQFGTDFFVDPVAWPMDHLLRTRFYLWSVEEQSWKAVGFSRRLDGSGKLGRPVVGASHRKRAVFLASRVNTLIPAPARGEGLMEFYDDADFLADLPANAALSG